MSEELAKTILSELKDIRNDIGEMKVDVGVLKVTTKATHDQTVKTNGRVTKLEIWRTRIITGFTVLTPMIAWVFSNVKFGALLKVFR